MNKSSEDVATLDTMGALIRIILEVSSDAATKCHYGSCRLLVVDEFVHTACMATSKHRCQINILIICNKQRKHVMIEAVHPLRMDEQSI